MSSKTGDSTALIFLHIPKTAGTTLNRVMERQYEKGTIWEIGLDQASMDRFTNLPEEERAQLRLVKGHRHFGLHEYLPKPSTYITFLRNPVDRVLSNYYYLKGNRRHVHHENIVNMNVMEFVNSRYSAKNVETKYLTGQAGMQPGGECTEEDLLKAKKNLSEYFTMVGITERFDESLLLLKKALGWNNVYYVKQNVSKNRPPRETLSEEDRKEIAKLNDYDMQIYDYALGLFEDQIKQYGPSLKKDLENFRSRRKILGWLLNPKDLLAGWALNISFKFKKIPGKAALRKIFDKIYGIRK